ncbi:spindle assembly checkpoint component Mad1 [Durotheca rogersii]|uniref:spindle assembly checkpoint component Mad1 n=1 Tax=Durotheca rogersii TaxID=419775 RepID=UPI00221EFAA6|nr:spindle assembly checkpoint component Mad1 [Durotheca rogersii]KAI5868334.1 spindle assembly checkpoint component Mad1 [Durotheca rogersii]
MGAHTPGSGSRRSIMTGQFRQSTGSGVPSRSRVTSFRTSLQQATQPSYNLFTGTEDAPTAPNARHSSRQSHEADGSQRALSRESSKENLAPPDAEEYETQRRRIEELKAEVATMRYKMESYEQEKEMLALQHDNELRDVRRKAEDDFKQKQAAEGEKSKAQRQYDNIQRELQELKETSTKEKLEWERKARDAEDEARLLKEQLEDLSAAKEEGDRMAQKKATDVDTQLANLRRTIQELEQDNSARESSVQTIQQQLAEKDQLIGELEADVLRLKAQTGDAETIAIIRRELTEQVQHIRSLEARNAKQHAELSHLRQVYKAVEIVEEEKRSLQRRLEAAEALEPALNEARVQRQRLEDERLAWTAYLQRASADGGMMEFDSPEAVARALVEERYNSASLLERLGEMQPQIVERDEIIKSLESDRKNLNAQIEKLKASPAPVSSSKAQARVERQRALALKEVEYLRAQLKTFDAEDETFDTGKFDESKAARISELERLVDQYKEEVQALQKELSAAEPADPGQQPATGSKRGRSDESESEQLGELNRKRRKLADELAKLQTQHQVLQKEHEVLQSRLAAAEAATKTRILSLRSNPTSDFEAVKTATLAALKQENRDLLAQLQREPRGGARGGGSAAVVPASQLAAARREVEEAQRETASAQKTARRLREVWGAKSREFKEAIFSTLGWTVTFLPGGKMRVESVYCASASAEDQERSIVFDGERGTMKVAGGPHSPFARRIADQIQFWVRDKGCIPGFLAALTLEFYEEHTRAGPPAAAAPAAAR